MFDEALTFVLSHPDAPARRYGISQGTYDTWRDEEDLIPRDVSMVTPREVATIYERDYWRRCGAVTLCQAGRPLLALLVFDAAAAAEDPLWSHRYVQAVVGTTCDGLWAEDTLDAVSRRSDLQLCHAFQRFRAMAARVSAGEAQHRVALTNAGLHGGRLPQTGTTGPETLARMLKRIRRGARRVGLTPDPLYAKQVA